MLLVSHIAVGSAIATLPGNIFFLIILSFLSHFALDMIPHAQAPTNEGYRPNKYTYPIVAADTILSFIFLYWFLRHFGLTVETALVIFASILPDLLDLTRYNKWFYKKFRIYYDFHDKVQNETWSLSGYISQVVIILIGLVLIFRK